MAADMAVVEQVLVGGDLAKLNPAERVSYYNRVCESLSLNPLTKPFEYLTLNGKTILYARRDCTEQLRRRDKVSVEIKAREIVEGVYVVTASARTPDNRTDESVGAVTIEGLKGENRANAMMKAETKAKRRVTLSICGLGMLDETEVDSINGPSSHVQPARQAIASPKEHVNESTGEVTEEPSDRALVEERLELMRECTNRAEYDDWAIATASASVRSKLTPAGMAHIKAEGKLFYATLPKTKTVAREPGDESETEMAGSANPSIPY